MDGYSKKDIKGEFGNYVKNHVNNIIIDMVFDLLNTYFDESIQDSAKYYFNQIYYNKPNIHRIETVKKLFSKNGISYDNIYNYRLCNYEKLDTIVPIKEGTFNFKKTENVIEMTNYSYYEKTKFYVIKNEYDFLKYIVKIMPQVNSSGKPYIWMRFDLKGDFDKMLKTMPEFKKADIKFYDMTNSEIKLNEEVIYTPKSKGGYLEHGFVTAILYDHIVIDNQNLFLYPNSKNNNIIVVNSKMNFKGILI